jgi:hypothetical protein
MDDRLDRDLHREAAERALGRSFGERIALTERDLDEVAKLEGLFGDWQRARSVKLAAYALHRAAVGVDPLAAETWAPRPLRRPGGSRTSFLRGLQLLWRARERGRLHGDLADEAMALLYDGLAWQASSAVPSPAHGARRCEGRSRAPQGSAGGARAGSGGSRRGGDRGDDSGGGGSDGSGGGSSGSGGSRRRRRINWPAVAGISAVVTVVLMAATSFGPLRSEPTAVTVTPKVIVKELQVPAPPRRAVVPAPVQGASKPAQHPRRDHASEAEAGVEP